MIQNWLVKILLFPLSLLFGLIVYLRNLAYDKKLLKSSEFSIPIISVGNLTIGGTGKTPHIEYLGKLLKDYLHVGILSRGYKRKTTGFLEVKSQMSAKECGDEPLQFKRKFGEDVVVAVGENRALAIPRLIGKHPHLQTLLLDDAFQHRSVKPFINILLTDYQRLFTNDFVLPSGRLREWPSSYERADLLIVTKCPDNLNKEAAEEIQLTLRPYPHQQLFFSTLSYDKPYYLFNRAYTLEPNPKLAVYLLSAIAHPHSLEKYVKENFSWKKSNFFIDHHYFTKMDIANVVKAFQWIKNENKIILTTEKDAMRLEEHKEYLLQNKIPIFVLPVQIRFLFDHEVAFQQTIKNQLLQFKS
jgi:tetraacyldisaccharide 4'-kinase